MTMGDLPQIYTNNMSNTSYGLGGGSGGLHQLLGGGGGLYPVSTTGIAPVQTSPTWYHTITGSYPPKQEKKVSKNTRRLVEVIIIDPDPQMPLKDAVLYQGERQLTELNDQELFFELDIKDLLALHNKRRVTVKNKKIKERDEFLEPVRVRDLKMVVVNVATFE